MSNNNVTSKRNKQKESFLNTISKHFNVKNFNRALGFQTNEQKEIKNVKVNKRKNKKV
jgi:hypothetical protein